MRAFIRAVIIPAACAALVVSPNPVDAQRAAQPGAATATGTTATGGTNAFATGFMARPNGFANTLNANPAPVGYGYGVGNFGTVGYGMSNNAAGPTGFGYGQNTTTALPGGYGYGVGTYGTVGMGYGIGNYNNPGLANQNPFTVGPFTGTFGANPLPTAAGNNIGFTGQTSLGGTTANTAATTNTTGLGQPSLFGAGFGNVTLGGSGTVVAPQLGVPGATVAPVDIMGNPVTSDSNLTAENAANSDAVIAGSAANALSTAGTATVAQPGVPPAGSNSVASQTTTSNVAPQQPNSATASGTAGARGYVRRNQQPPIVGFTYGLSTTTASPISAGYPGTPLARTDTNAKRDTADNGDRANHETARVGTMPRRPATDTAASQQNVNVTDPLGPFGPTPTTGGDLFKQKPPHAKAQDRK